MSLKTRIKNLEAGVLAARSHDTPDRPPEPDWSAALAMMAEERKDQRAKNLATCRNEDERQRYLFMEDCFEQAEREPYEDPPDAGHNARGIRERWVRTRAFALFHSRYGDHYVHRSFGAPDGRGEWYWKSGWNSSTGRCDLPPFEPYG